MLEELSSTRVETVHLSAELGQFEIEPLASGFGLTVGNALRRVLLSSLPGAAVTAIKIEGVHHEFSTIPGVREDTTELILNLKQVRLKSYTQDPVNVRLEATGPGVISAGDISVPAEIEIVNPELPIATLDNRDAKLEMILTIENGRGYLMADGREEPSIGVIPIDAVFSPIRRVNYRVEKTRVGARTDYDKLLLEIQTDGSLSPKEALAQAAQVLIDHFAIFAQLGGVMPQAVKPGISQGPIPSRLQDMPIEVLDLSSRTYNCLKRSQITTVGQLLQMSEEELLGLRNFGQKSLVELHEKLAQHGIIPAEDDALSRGPSITYDVDNLDDTEDADEIEEEIDEPYAEYEEKEHFRASPRVRRGGGRRGRDDYDD